jgi:photosystem II stability/assembly factor-like uncharacterized protein
MLNEKCFPVIPVTGFFTIFILLSSPILYAITTSTGGFIQQASAQEESTSTLTSVPFSQQQEQEAETEEQQQGEQPTPTNQTTTNETITTHTNQTTLTNGTTGALPSGCRATTEGILCPPGTEQPSNAQAVPQTTLTNQTLAASEETWVSIGPYGIPLSNNDVISGQVNAIAVHPKDANILYIGASEGGVWKTTDGGGSWEPLTDFNLNRNIPSGVERSTLSIGSLAIDPSSPETVYVGTGDPNVACCNNGPGLGVFRSSDNGMNWEPLGMQLNRPDCTGNDAMSQSVVNKIVIGSDPVNSMVFAATNRGLFRYIEDGSSGCWVQLTNGLPSSGIGNAIDMVMDPVRKILYVAFSGKGIFKAIDRLGDTWKEVTPPTIKFIPPARSTFERIALAISPSQVNVLYAGFNAGGKYRLFTTLDAGNSWRPELPSPPNDSQLHFNNVITVDPGNPDIVYVGQVSLWRTIDGGKKGGANDYKGSSPITGNSWTNLSCCLAEKNPFRNGLDLHADIHDIVFAPRGSFSGSPSVAKIVYIANDGGVTKGVINDVGVVSWQSLTNGLAIGQCGVIGLSPSNVYESSCGLWHNGNALIKTSGSYWQQIGGGDGFQITIDAASSTDGPTIIYYNCNAGSGGDICRATVKFIEPPLGPLTGLPIVSLAAEEKIWSASSATVHWSDSYRPGDLLRLQSGKLFRTDNADTAAASDLDKGSAWRSIEPVGKSGDTTTVAFKRSLSINEDPVYFIGTTTGQIWRGSPEVGWQKICEPTQCVAKVNAIATDLKNPDRIVAVFDVSNSPGRIKELTRLPAGTWAVKDIDANFNPPLKVNKITSVVIDPLDSNTVFVGTDQGIYHGRLEGDAWVWTHSEGVPNVWITDLEAHQRLGEGPTGVVRAGTFGRGLFELVRASQISTSDTAEVVVESIEQNSSEVSLVVQATQIGEDGAPPSPRVPISVTNSTGTFQQVAPFEVSLTNNTEVSLRAPDLVREGNEILQFVGWAAGGNKTLETSGATASLTLTEDMIALAYYELKERIPDPAAGPLTVSVSASIEQACIQSTSHELTASWAISGGQRPAEVTIEITNPNGQIETFGVKPLSGSQIFPLNFPDGGHIDVKVVARDWTNSTSSQNSSVELTACPTTAITGSISGFKLNDINSNGRQDMGEKGLSNWSISLSGITGSGKDTKVIRKQTFTNATGFYRFDNLPAGTYRVIEKLERGFAPTVSPVKHIKLNQGEDSINNNFTNRQLR